jgi:hypothetical protein
MTEPLHPKEGAADGYRSIGMSFPGDSHVFVTMSSSGNPIENYRAELRDAWQAALLG